MPSKPKNKPGDRYGRWTLIEHISERKWLCKCDCGKLKEVYTCSLRSGASQSCGCKGAEENSARLKQQYKDNPEVFKGLLESHKPEDITGLRSGRLVAIEFVNGLWLCKCDCGENTYAKTSELKSGMKKSCGCIARERSQKKNERLQEKRRSAKEAFEQRISKYSKQKGTPRIDLTGMRFERLVAVEYVGKGCWLCQCDCGNKSVVQSSKLRDGSIRGCGCINREGTIERNKKHGFAKDPLYCKWQSIKERTRNKNSRNYQRYGAKGIDICDEWASDFTIFKRDLEALPHCLEDGFSLDRINPFGNYEPGNLRWASRHVQAVNTKHNWIKHFPILEEHPELAEQYVLEAQKVLFNQRDVFFE